MLAGAKEWKKTGRLPDVEKGVRFGYTGSSGDNTPDSPLRVLRRYKRLAEQK